MIWIHTCLYNWITLDLCDIFRNCKTWIWYFYFLACCCCFHLTFLATEQIDQTLETFHCDLRSWRIWNFTSHACLIFIQNENWLDAVTWLMYVLWLVWKVKEPNRNVTLIGHSFYWLTVASVSVCNIENETELNSVNS